jgi:hypothetical protein
VIHIHITQCLSRVYGEPSVLILKNALDLYDPSVITNTHWKVCYVIDSDKRAVHTEVISVRILFPAGQITSFLSTTMQ